MARWPSFERSAGALLTEMVRVTASAASGSMRGTVIERLAAIDGLRCSIQPRSALANQTLAGRYTDATDFLFCRALDAAGKPLALKMDAMVEETAGRRRRWSVISDAENYADVFLAVPLRPVVGGGAWK